MFTATRLSCKGHSIHSHIFNSISVAIRFCQHGTVDGIVWSYVYDGVNATIVNRWHESAIPTSTTGNTLGLRLWRS